LQNLREALQRVLDRHQRALQAIQVPARRPDSLPGAATPAPSGTPADGGVLDRAASGRAPTDAPPAGSMDSMPAASGEPNHTGTRVEAARQRSRERRHARYAAVMALHSAGVSARAIAKQLHLSRTTVTRFVAADAFPERALRRARPSILDPFIPYMQARWQAGCDNGMQLWRDIRTQGYRGSRALVAGWVARQRGVLPAAPDEAGVPKRRGRRPREQAQPPAPRALSARRAAWLLIRRPTDLEPDEHAVLEQLTATCSIAAVAYGLAQAFTQLVRERNAAALDGWFAAVEESGLADLRSFAAGLRRDEAAVRAGLSLPWSQGQVEGQVNRLKLIKREGYGRANFDLLRHRVLAA